MKRTLLIFVTFALLLPPALPAKASRIGAQVIVTFIDGSSLHGELHAIDRDRIFIFTDDNTYLHDRLLANVSSVRMLSLAGKRKDRALLGAIIGLIIGISLRPVRGDSHYFNYLEISSAILAGAALGATLTPAIKKYPDRQVDRLFLFQDQDAENRAAAIQELNEQARDRLPL
jgi:hypothetical protein